MASGFRIRAPPKAKSECQNPFFCASPVPAKLLLLRLQIMPRLTQEVRHGTCMCVMYISVVGLLEVTQTPPPHPPDPRPPRPSSLSGSLPASLILISSSGAHCTLR